MADWVDNGNALTRAEWSENAREQHRLKSIINDRSSNIHRIDEDIEKLELAIQDTDRAIEGFRDAANDMQLLESEVALVFRGESSVAFLSKVTNYKNYCLKRIENMESLKANYSNQIKQLKYQKFMAQNLINTLREHLERLRRALVRR